MQSYRQRERRRRAMIRESARTAALRERVSRGPSIRVADTIAAYVLTFGCGFLIGGAPIWWPLLMRALH